MELRIKRRERERERKGGVRGVKWGTDEEGRRVRCGGRGGSRIRT